MWWEQNRKATQLENISDRWNICQAVFSCEYASSWYMPVNRAWHLFHLLYWGFLKKEKLLCKAAELKRQQSNTSLTKLYLSWGKQKKHQVLISSKVLSLDESVIQRNLKAGSVSSSPLDSYSLLPTRHHFASLRCRHQMIALHLKWITTTKILKNMFSPDVLMSQ